MIGRQTAGRAARRIKATCVLRRRAAEDRLEKLDNELHKKQVNKVSEDH